MPRVCHRWSLYGEIKHLFWQMKWVKTFGLWWCTVLLNKLCYFTIIICFTLSLLVIIQFLIYFLNVFSHSLAPLYENQCSYIHATVADFLHWTRGQKDVGPFSEYSCLEYWAYADYKYIAMLFHDQPFMFEVNFWLFFKFTLVSILFYLSFSCMKMSV